MDRNNLILVVDDDEDNLLLLKLKIKSLGYQVITAMSGFEAIKLAEKEEPDVVLLDVRMPDMDGFEVCRHFKNNEKLMNIPVIFLTALTNEKDLVKGLDLGAQDYIVKTFEIEELAARIKVALRIKSLQSQLMTENRKLEAILENIPEGVFTIDKDGRILQWNKGAETITGYLCKEVAGQDFRNIISFFNDKKTPVEEIYDISSIIRKGLKLTLDRDELYLLSKERQYIPVTLNFSPIISDGKTTSLVVTLYDLSRQKAIEKMKEELLVTVSHDLKTPLAAIRGFIEMLFHPAYKGNEEKREEILKKIRTASSSLIRLINNLLFLHKMDSDFTKVSLSEFSLVELLSTVVETFTPTAEDKCLDLVSEVPGGIDVCADREKIEEVLYNLISNSIKYTDREGKILVSAVETDEGVRISISDTGRGIASEELKKIFKKFYQAGKTRNGHGLGLYICDRIIRAHKSRLFVESTEGSGSVFHFQLKSARKQKKGKQ